MTPPTEGPGVEIVFDVPGDLPGEGPGAEIVLDVPDFPPAPPGPPNPSLDEPELEGSAAALAQRLWPLLQADSPTNSWAEHFRIMAYGSILDAGAHLRLVTEDSPDYAGWAIIADPEAAPVEWLPFTADMYGVDLVQGQAEQDARDQIRDLPAHRRGTITAIVNGVAATLTGTRTVVVDERASADGYALTVHVHTSECPSPDLSARAALSQKPAAVSLTFIVGEGTLINELAGTIDGLAGTIDSLT